MLDETEDESFPEDLETDRSLENSFNLLEFLDRSKQKLEKLRHISRHFLYDKFSISNINPKNPSKWSDIIFHVLFMEFLSQKNIKIILEYHTR